MQTTDYPSPQQIEFAKTRRGGWTKPTLLAWGVPWPPPHGWRRFLEKQWQREQDGQPLLPRPKGWVIVKFVEDTAGDHELEAELDERLSRAED